MSRVLFERLSAAPDWVFDLDNTLYPARSGFFDQIGVRMTSVVARTLDVDHDEALRLQKLYYERHGATLAGLIACHQIDPHAFLAEVHDVDLSPIAPDPELARLIDGLPGRKLVFTNGSRAHADRLVGHLGLDGLFDAHFGIEDAAFVPKPQPAAFGALHTAHSVDPNRAVMIEDSLRNLETAHALGYATILIAAPPVPPSACVHLTGDCLKATLATLLGETATAPAR